MSFKRIETIGDLVRFGCSLRIDCGHCHAANTLSTRDAMMIGSRLTLEKLKKRLKCSRCGRKEASLVVLDPL